MPAKWDVNAVLDEVMSEIEKASALPFEATAVTALRKNYQGPFQAQHDAGADWSQAKPTILGRAREVGLLAGLMAKMKAREAVDPLRALIAGYLVSLVCLYGEAELGTGGHPSGNQVDKATGVYCKGIPKPTGASDGSLEHDLELARQVLGSFRVLRGFTRH